MRSTALLRKSMLLLVTLGLLSGTCAQAAPASNMFLVRSTDKSIPGVISAVQSYTHAHHWILLDTNKIKKGKIVLMKVCIPSVGKEIFRQGLYLSAMLPCGNLGVYSQMGKTHVSMLNSAYMHMLVPTPAMAKVVKEVEPMMEGLLTAITQ